MSKETDADQPSSGWIITTCPSCEREIKLRSSVGRDQVACPYCSERLSAPEEPEGTAAEVESEEGEAPAQAAEEDSWHAGGTARSKKKSTPPATVEEPEWDRDPSAPKESAGDDEDVTEFVEVDPDNPDQVRKRRVKRTQSVSGWQKFSRLLLLGFVTLVAAGGIALLVIAIVKGTGTATKDIQKIAALPEEVQRLIAEAAAGDKIQMAVNSAEWEAVFAVIDGFHKAQTNEERLAFVRMPQQVAPLMEKWYDENPPPPATPRKIELARKEKIRARYFIIAAALMEPDGAPRFYSLEQTANDIKLDWEVSDNYQAVPFDKFKAARPTTGTDFRVKVIPAGYYDGLVFDEENYQCFQLMHPGQPKLKLFGYAQRNSEVGRLLIDAMSTSHPSWILSLAYPPASKSDNQVLILAVSHPSWFY